MLKKFREGVSERKSKAKQQDQDRLAELQAKGNLTAAEDRELNILLADLPAEDMSPESHDEERARVYKYLENLSPDQWKSVLDMLRQRNLLPPEAPVVTKED